MPLLSLSGLGREPWLLSPPLLGPFHHLLDGVGLSTVTFLLADPQSTPPPYIGMLWPDLRGSSPLLFLRD